MNSELEALATYCYLNQYDPVGYGVLADWIEERGFTNVAKAIRQCATSRFSKYHEMSVLRFSDNSIGYLSTLFSGTENWNLCKVWQVTKRVISWSGIDSGYLKPASFQLIMFSSPNATLDDVLTYLQDSSSSVFLADYEEYESYLVGMNMRTDGPRNAYVVFQLGKLFITVNQNQPKRVLSEFAAFFAECGLTGN
jgi:hypothetical protein